MGSEMCIRDRKMAGQYGNVRVTTQNLKVVKLLEDENLILVEGSVPGSKNGIVTLSDAVKHDLPKEVPFPAGLRTPEPLNDKIMPASENTNGEFSENEGAKGEN